MQAAFNVLMRITGLLLCWSTLISCSMMGPQREAIELAKNFEFLEHKIELENATSYGDTSFIQTPDFLIVERWKEVSFTYSIGTVYEGPKLHYAAGLDDELVNSLAKGDAYYTVELRCDHCEVNEAPLPPQPLVFDFETNSTNRVGFSFTPDVELVDKRVQRSRVAVSISKNGREIDQVPIDLCIVDRDALRDYSFEPSELKSCSEAIRQTKVLREIDRPSEYTGYYMSMDNVPRLKASLSNTIRRISRSADANTNDTAQVRLSSVTIPGRGAVIWVEIYDRPFRDWLENGSGVWDAFESSVEQNHTNERVLTLSFDAERDLAELKRYKSQFHMLLSCVMLREADLSASNDDENDLWKAARTGFWRLIMTSTGCEDPIDPKNSDEVFFALYMAGEALSDDIGKHDWKNFKNTLGYYQSTIASNVRNQWGDRFLEFYEPMRLESRLGGLPIQFLHTEIDIENETITRSSDYPQFFGFLFDIANFNDLVENGTTKIRDSFQPKHTIFIGYNSNLSNEDGDSIDDQLEATSNRVAEKISEFLLNETEGVELLRPRSSEELRESLIDGASDLDLIWAFTHGDAHGLSVDQNEQSRTRNFLSQNNLILSRSSLDDLSSYDRFSVSDIKGLQVPLWKKIQRTEWPKAPIVALMACESGAPGIFSYAGDDGFVSAFLDRGASAVISTEAEIDEQSALEFSHYFLISLRESEDNKARGPSNAVWYARAAMYENGFGNMFGLMISYTGVHGGVISN